jgi:hypothetical protein
MFLSSLAVETQQPDVSKNPLMRAYQTMRQFRHKKKQTIDEKKQTIKDSRIRSHTGLLLGMCSKLLYRFFLSIRLHCLRLLFCFIFHFHF